MTARAGDPVALEVDVHDVVADLAAVDALARLALVARRFGREVRLRRASPELGDLIELAGLSEVLPAELSL
jgi:ABC-type transporter Mla MlaB component